MKPSLFIYNQWKHGTGEAFTSHNPATGEVLWEGYGADAVEIDEAIKAAQAGFESWHMLPLEERIKFLESFAQLLQKEIPTVSETISLETGKPLWESHGEVTAIFNKVALSIEAYKERCPEKMRKLPNGKLITHHKPYGVLAVFGPFNFPGHLPHGHIIPALLAGNSIIFKPSEFTPLTGETFCRLWERSGLPPGVLNLIQGGPATGKMLAQHPDLDGLLFTGSYRVGQQLAHQFAATPGKILALELGGNNPLVIGEIEEYTTAAYLTIQSAYLTAGQRCSCARRLIVPHGKKGDEFLETLKEMIGFIQVGPYTTHPEPFMGPLIHQHAAKQVLDAQEQLINLKGRPLVLSKLLIPNTPFVSPGLIDVTNITDKPDEEIFGPLLQVIRVPNLTAAIIEANRTKFGLTAALLSDNPGEYEYFYKKIKAGVVNWNGPTTGASGQAPFGGIGCSGNLRPSGYYAADYCTYPVASTETPTMQLPPVLTPGINL